jgi:hypothetical protein
MAIRFALVAILLLSGCSLTLPVSGLVEGTGETFSGKATGYTDGAGTLEITGNSGVVCNGSFVYVTPREGEGVFRCSDGRSGPFRFVSTGKRGTGQGDLGGKRFTFTFG